MKKKLTGRLVISKETISELGDAKMSQVKGGSMGTSGCLSWARPNTCGCSFTCPPSPTDACLSDACSEIPG